MVARNVPGLGLVAFWDLGADGWKEGMDINLQTLSALCQTRVESMTTALPNAPAQGVMYIVPQTDTTNGRKIAIYDGPTGALAWVYFVPKEGYLVYVKDADRFVWFNGADWVPLVSGSSGGGGEGGVGVKSDQWRILFKTNGGDGRVGVGEIEMRAFPTGPDLTVDGTASVSSVYQGTASNVFDNNNATVWMANGVNGQWAAYAFPEPVTIEYLLIRSITDAGYAVTTGPKSFDVQYLDGSDWVTYWSWDGMTFTGAANQQAAYREDFQVGIPKGGAVNQALVKKSNADFDVEWVEVATEGGSGHEYWRILPLTNNSSEGYIHATELKFMSEVGGAQLATGGVPLESGHYSSSVAANAFDNNNATLWESNNASIPSGGVWIGYQFPTKVDIKALAYTLNLGYENDERIVTGKMQWSDDGVNWTDAFMMAFAWSGNSGYQTIVVTHPDLSKARTISASGNFVDTDAGRTVIVDSATAATVTIPSGITLQVGDVLSVLQKGAGQVTVAGASGVTLNVPGTFAAKTKFRYGIMSFMMTGDNEFTALGALASA